jgi:ribosomal protein S18 acetylase RimI-like enzyme
MIVPSFTQFEPHHQKDLNFLFQICAQEWDMDAMYNPETTLLAWHKGQLVGFLTAWYDDQPYAFMDNLIVHPDFRNKGIGFWLVITMKDILFAKGVRAIRAIVSDEYLDGLCRYGFKEVKGAITVEIKNEKSKS